MKFNLRRGDEWINVSRINPERSVSGEIQLSDLDFPWPWETSSADEIRAIRIFQYIHDVPPFAFSQVTRHPNARVHCMNESWRVLKPGGLLTIECIDSSREDGLCKMDPMHVTSWTPNMLYSFLAGNVPEDSYGIKARFKMDNTLSLYRNAPAMGLFTARLVAIKDMDGRHEKD